MENLYEQLLLETAAWDETANVASRRSGKQKLERLRQQAKAENKKISVALYDVNEMQAINDRYGQKEGDKVLRFIAEVCGKKLEKNDYIFRLSSDEFIVAFYGKSRSEAEKCMKEILEQLKMETQEASGYDGLSFCYGVVEIYPEENVTVSDILSKADDKMYQEKRRYHILKAQRSIQNKRTKTTQPDMFEYDKEHLYEAIEESTDDYVFVGNMKTGAFRYPPAMVEEFGLPGEVVENAAAFWGKLIHPHDEKGFLESNQEIADGRAEYHDIEYRARNVLGEWNWLRCRGKMVRDKEGCPSLFAGTISNLGKRDRIDHMTGLYNRFEFEGDIKKYLVDQENVKNMGIMILDMDSFRNINDLYNRSFGDEILRITAQKIASKLPANAKLYRMDGDEFGVVVLNGDSGNCVEIFEKIQKISGKQQEYRGKKYFCTISAGCVNFPRDAVNYLDLLKYANYSLETSKSAGKNRITVFSDDILKYKKRRLELTELLRESMERGFAGFSVYYQQQTGCKTKTIRGAEALARWKCDKYGSVSPVEFIPILEETGMIIPFGGWVLTSAVRQCSEWIKKIPDFHMSINLSYLQLLEGEFCSYLDDILQETGLEPSHITLELTETYLVKADREILDMLEQMRRKGILIAMDDFGVGYSSMYMLKNIPVDIVKIDKGFVKGITKDQFDVTFIRSITELCHNVGKIVCLEGVETQEEYEIVRRIGPEFIQGYYFGRPKAAEEFEKDFPVDNRV